MTGVMFMSLDQWLGATPEFEEASGPTTCPPGSAGKIRILTMRVTLGLPLWHPCDATMNELTDERHDLNRGQNMARLRNDLKGPRRRRNE